MLSNYLAAALRNFARNRVYSIIVTLSLAIGFAAMMLAAIYWRYEHSFDRMWPNADRIYLVRKMAHGFGPPIPGQPIIPQAMWSDPSASTAALISEAIPGVEAVTRTKFDALWKLETQRIDARIRLGRIDANFFDFFPVKIVVGDLATALQPGWAAITRSTAEKYFGRVDVVGETADLRMAVGRDKLPIRIAAVIEDWPADSHLDVEILVGGVGEAAGPDAPATVYVRVSKETTEESLAMSLRALSSKLPATSVLSRKASSTQLKPIPLRFAYNRPKAYGTVDVFQKKAPLGLDKVFVGLGGLMLAVSCINFINLMTARGAGRAVEVGVRKVVGARRRDLVIQFVGEGLIYAGAAFVIALALVELTRPLISSLTGHAMPFSYSGSLDLLMILLAGAMVVGAAASLYPALALSNIRPIRAIRNEFSAISGSPWLRQALVVLQFTPLLILAGGGLAAYGQQRDYLENSLKISPDRALVLREPCDPALKTQIGAIPGVRSVACLYVGGFESPQTFNGIVRQIGDFSPLNIASLSNRLSLGDVSITDRAALEYYDTQVIAGRLWSSAADDRGLVVSEYTSRALGYEPRAAIGRMVALRDVETKEVSDHPIIGVVAERGGVTGLGHTVYATTSEPSLSSQGAGIRFTEDADLAAATEQIDRLFMAAKGRMPRRAFERDEVKAQSERGQKSLVWVAASVGVGMLMSIGGIFAMAVFLANLRTREIGVRKVFGASRAALLRLLVLQFVRPVLLANLVAMPVVIWAANQAAREMPIEQRSTLALSSIAAVVVGSLAITTLATFSQAWRVTGKLPLKALRSE